MAHEDMLHLVSVQCPFVYMYIRPTSQQSIVGYLSRSISGARSAAARGTHSATVRWARAPLSTSLPYMPASCQSVTQINDPINRNKATVNLAT